MADIVDTQRRLLGRLSETEDTLRDRARRMQSLSTSTLPADLELPAFVDDDSGAAPLPGMHSPNKPKPSVDTRPVPTLLVEDLSEPYHAPDTDSGVPSQTPSPQLHAVSLHV